jgi:hypothetical protein
MEDYKMFVAAKSTEGKIPLSEVYRYIKVNYRIPERTAQWYAKEGLFPRPDKNWKDGFYPSDVAIELCERAYLIARLKEYMSVKFNTIRNIFRRYEDNMRPLFDELIPVVKEYQAFKPGPDPYEPVLNEENAEIVRRICEKIEQGVPLEEISAPDMQEEIKKEG